MSKRIDLKSLSRRIEKEAKDQGLLMTVIKSAMTRAKVLKFSEDLAKSIKSKVVRSGYTPNSDVSLFEMRRKGLVVVLLVMRAKVDEVVTVEPTTDHEVAEIEFDIYSSNINDVYVRLVSDIF